MSHPELHIIVDSKSGSGQAHDPALHASLSRHLNPTPQFSPPLTSNSLIWNFEGISLDVCVQMPLYPIDIWGFVNMPQPPPYRYNPSTCNLCPPPQSCEPNPFATLHIDANCEQKVFCLYQERTYKTIATPVDKYYPSNNTKDRVFGAIVSNFSFFMIFQRVEMCQTPFYSLYSEWGEQLV